MKNKKSKKVEKKKDNVFCEGDNCYCDMQKKLNDLFPYYMPNCLTEDEYNILKNNLIDKNKLSEDNKENLLSVYNSIFKQSRTYGDKVYNHLDRVYKEYEPTGN